MILLLTRKLSDKEARHEAIDSIKGRHIQGKHFATREPERAKMSAKPPITKLF